MQTHLNNINHHKKNRWIGLGFLIFLGFFASPSQAQVTGTTDIDIDFPPLLILFYYSNVDLTISAANLEAVVLSVANPVDRGTHNTGTSFTTDLAIDSSTNFNSTVTLTLQNAWAIRSVGNAGTQVQVTVALTDDTLLHSGGGGESLVLSNIQTTESVGATSGAVVTFAHQGLGTAVTGDISMDVSLANAGLAGSYEDGEYTVTGESI